MSTIYDWLKEGSTVIPNCLINNYQHLGLTSDEFVFIIFLMSKLSQGQAADEIFKMANQLGWSVDQLYEVIDSLMDKQYLSIELLPNAEGKHQDHYTLRPLFQGIDQDNYVRPKTVNPGQAGQNRQALVQDFEREFGRVLSPLELETLNTWINEDRYPLDLIRLALREAVIHQALSFNYIDKILLNWQKDNIRTVTQAEALIDSRSKKQAQDPDPDQAYDHFKIPIYDWQPKD